MRRFIVIVRKNDYRMNSSFSSINVTVSSLNQFSFSQHKSSYWWYKFIFHKTLHYISDRDKAIIRLELKKMTNYPIVSWVLVFSTNDISLCKFLHSLWEIWLCIIYMYMYIYIYIYIYIYTVFYFNFAGVIYDLYFTH